MTGAKPPVEERVPFMVALSVAKGVLRRHWILSGDEVQPTCETTVLKAAWEAFRPRCAL